MFINAYVTKVAALWIILSILFPPHTLSAHSPKRDSFQPSGPVTVTEDGDKITIEWTVPADIIEEADALESLSQLGWNNELLDHIRIPAYTFTGFENRATSSEETPSSEENPASLEIAIDITEQQVWPQSVELSTLPDLADPTGELVPHIGPSEPPEELVPTESVFILRDGLVRGVRRYVVAISPLYRDDETIYIVSRGKATIRGATMEKEEPRIPNPSLTTAPTATPTSELNSGAEQEIDAEEDVEDLESGETSEETNRPLSIPLTLPNNSSQRLPLTSPLALPNSTQPSAENNIPLTLTLTRPDDPPQQLLLTSPLALPNSTSQRVPLTSPLTSPTQTQEPLAAEPEPTSSPTSQPTVVTEPVTSTVETAPVEVSSSPADGTPIPTTAQTTTPSATTPWTGLLTFVLFGVAFMGLLISSRE